MSKPIINAKIACFLSFIFFNISHTVSAELNCKALYKKIEIYKPTCKINFLHKLKSLSKTDFQKKRIQKDDSLYFKKLRDSFAKYLNQDLKKALIYAKKAIKLAEDLDVNEFKGIAYGNYAVALRCTDYHDSTEVARMYYEKSKEIAIALNDSTGIISINNDIFQLYRSRKLFSEALQEGLENLKISRSFLKKRRDSINFAIAYGNLGVIYKDLKLWDSAAVNFKKSAILFKSAKNDLQYVVKLYEGQVYSEQGNHELAILRYKEIEKELSQVDNMRVYLSQVNQRFSISYEALELPETAIFYLKKALVLSEKDSLRSGIGLHLGLARNYLKVNKLDSSRIYFNKVVNNYKKNKNLETLIEINEIKITIHEKEKDSISALKAYRKVIELKDSLAKVKNIPDVTKVLLSDKENQFKITKSNVSRTIQEKDNMLTAIIIFVIVIGLVIYGLLQKYSSKIKLLYTREIDLGTTVKELKEEKDYLARKVTTSDVKLAIKRDLLDEINSELEIIKEKNIPKSVKKSILNTQGQINYNVKLEKNWQNFFNHFEKVHPYYISQLKEKFNLSSNELRLCAFLKMNMSKNEISQILNITNGAVYTMLHRLKKKLNLPKDKSVFDFLHSEEW